jgi:hypothetical protein
MVLPVGEVGAADDTDRAEEVRHLDLGAHVEVVVAEELHVLGHAEPEYDMIVDPLPGSHAVEAWRCAPQKPSVPLNEWLLPNWWPISWLT